MARPAHDGSLGRSRPRSHCGSSGTNRTRVSRCVRGARSANRFVSFSSLLESRSACSENLARLHRKILSRKNRAASEGGNQNRVPHNSVQEMAKAGEDHGEAEAIARGDDVAIADGAARLNEGFGAGFGGFF